MIRQLKLFLWVIIIYGFGEIKNSEAFNILGVVTSLSRSHTIYASSIFNELVNSGHSITVLSPYPQEAKINHISIEDLLRKKSEKVSDLWENSDHIAETLKHYETSLQHVERVIEHESFKKLFKLRLSIDMIIFDYDYNEALLGLGEYFNCPIIILNIGESHALLNRLIGVRYPLSNLYLIQKYQTENIFQFIKNYFANFIDRLIIDFYYYPRQRQLYAQAFNDMNHLELDNLIEKFVSKILISSLNFDKSILSPTDMMDVTGIHIPDKNHFEYALSERLEQFIHSAEDGCIYVSFGPDINPSNIRKEKINILFRVLYKRPEKVIWAWNGNTTAFGISNDFYFAKWLPQDDILRHPNIKLFITNGGDLSLTEALYHEIPIIGIPFNRDQSKKLDLFKRYGLGVKINFDNISIETITQSINEILDNGRYHENLLQISYKFQNRPISPLKMMKHLLKTIYEERHDDFIKINKQSKYSLIDFYLLDVYAISLLILVTAVLSIAILLKYLFRMILIIFARKKLKTY